ncbi:peptidyl-prolyl cis-trans isomerase FKBP20-1 [Prunus yedoensis var. nudiflora]|uniref:peptidylprolyl isomerase n=1 Tax=Prunus yedoensis var. nudiflora TaxID=2094558 RepID=A0A314YJ65_PRUYE|nr:peptidyl-prolyl cis-trans isomerase FKBP20-1 [Prunus yedoensis var. nudiflora]
MAAGSWVPHVSLSDSRLLVYLDVNDAHGHRTSRLYDPIYRLPFNPTTRLPCSVSEAAIFPRNGPLKIASVVAMSDAIDLSGDGGVLKKIVRHAKPDAIAPTQDLPLVDVHYEGILEETNEVFDTTHEDNTVFSFELGKGSVIKAWDIAVKTMKVGEIAKITCKPEYAYGSAGSPPDIPPEATLIFEVELVACNPRKGLSLGSASEERARLE